MKRLFTFSILLFSFLFGTSKEIEVCLTCSVSSIQQAHDLASAYDVINIKKGIYPTHSVQLLKPITLQGEEGAILDAEQEGEILIIHSDSVNIFDLTFQNVPLSYTKDWAAISSDKANYCRIENNTLLNNFFGMYIRKSKHFSILNNRVVSNATQEVNSGNAIHLWYCDSMNIQNNLVKNHRDGIYFEFVKRSLIKNNVSEGNVRYGLHFMFSNENHYIENTFENNGSGVAVMYGDKIEMTGNTFINNWGPASYGLLLKEIKDGKIHNNLFKKNTTAIYGEGAMRMDIRNNRFESNGWAMKILSSCMENKVVDNDFLS
ncbi:MAG: NosD domain-containing protein, partial [Salibacteraceae bacterium]